MWIDGFVTGLGIMAILIGVAVGLIQFVDWMPDSIYLNFPPPLFQ